jgi:hypothetical protein
VRQIQHRLDRGIQVQTHLLHKGEVGAFHAGEHVHGVVVRLVKAEPVTPGDLQDVESPVVRVAIEEALAGGDVDELGRISSDGQVRGQLPILVVNDQHSLAQLVQSEGKIRQQPRLAGARSAHHPHRPLVDRGRHDESAIGVFPSADLHPVRVFRPHA